MSQNSFFPSPRTNCNRACCWAQEEKRGRECETKEVGTSTSQEIVLVSCQRSRLHLSEQLFSFLKRKTGGIFLECLQNPLKDSFFLPSLPPPKKIPRTALVVKSKSSVGVDGSLGREGGSKRMGRRKTAAAARGIPERASPLLPPQKRRKWKKKCPINYPARDPLSPPLGASKMGRKKREGRGERGLLLTWERERGGRGGAKKNFSELWEKQKKKGFLNIKVKKMFPRASPFSFKQTNKKRAYDTSSMIKLSETLYCTILQ